MNEIGKFGCHAKESYRTIIVTVLNMMVFFFFRLIEYRGPRCVLEHPSWRDKNISELIRERKMEGWMNGQRSAWIGRRMH